MLLNILKCTGPSPQISSGTKVVVLSLRTQTQSDSHNKVKIPESCGVCSLGTERMCVRCVLGVRLGGGLWFFPFHSNIPATSSCGS